MNPSISCVRCQALRLIRQRSSQLPYAAALPTRSPSSAVRRRTFSTVKGGRYEGASQPKEGDERKSKRDAPLSGLGEDLLQDTEADKVYISGYDTDGFEVGGVNVRSSIMVFPNTLLSWGVDSIDEINEDSLELVGRAEPAVTLLLVGLGARFEKRLNPKIHKHFLSKGIVIEEMATAHAASTFNILNGEERSVAAALLRGKYDDDDQKSNQSI